MLLIFADMHENNANCGPLLEMTATALDEVALQLLLVSTQKTNLHLCIEWAVKMYVMILNQKYGKLMLNSALWKVICAQDCSVPLERLLVLWFPHTKVCCIV